MMKALHLFICLSLMLLCCQAIEVKPNGKEFSPFKDSMLVNEFEYDGVFSIERLTENNRLLNYTMRMRLYNEKAHKDATIRPMLANRFPPDDGFPVASDGLDLFGKLTKDKSKKNTIPPYTVWFTPVRNMAVDINKYEYLYLDGNSFIVLRNDIYQFNNTTLTKESVVKGITWAVRNNLPNSDKANDIFVFDTEEVMDFPDDVKLDLKKDVVKWGEDFTLTFPQVKNADALYFTFSSEVGNENTGEGFLKGYLKYTKGDATSITIRKAEQSFIGFYKGQIVTQATKFRAKEINGKKFLFKSVAYNIYYIQ